MQEECLEVFCWTFGRTFRIIITRMLEEFSSPETNQGLYQNSSNNMCANKELLGRYSGEILDEPLQR